jgi:hypothetical protein
VTTDDNTVLHVNGALVDATPHVWTSPQTYTVVLYRHPSRVNVIAAEGVNTGAIDGRDRGLLFELTARVDGVDRVVVSDAAWSFRGTLEAGWTDVGFDDGAWGSATELGAHGIGPWGPILGTSSAIWIWSFDPNVPVGAKPGAERVYFRRELSFAIDGSVGGTPAACP